MTRNQWFYQLSWNAAIRREALTLLARKSAKVKFSNRATKLSHPLSHPLPHPPSQRKIEKLKNKKSCSQVSSIKGLNYKTYLCLKREHLIFAYKMVLSANKSYSNFDKAVEKIL